MVAFVKLNGFVEHLGKGVHQFGTHQLAIALSNTAPGSEGTPPTGAASACILANVTQVAYTYASSRSVTTTSYSQTSGTATLVLADLILSASGGSVGPFRYTYLVNTGATLVTNPLVGYWDLGSSDTITTGDARVFDFASSTISIGP
jgi:hypothetical protein